MPSSSSSELPVMREILESPSVMHAIDNAFDTEGRRRAFAGLTWRLVRDPTVGVKHPRSEYLMAAAPGSPVTPRIVVAYKFDDVRIEVDHIFFGEYR